jgi:transcriptional regulator with XRE-family HTH domain
MSATLSIPQRCDLATIEPSCDNFYVHEGRIETVTRRGPRLSTALRRARQERGLSMSELAAQAGVDKAQVSRLESGETTQPLRSTLNQLANVLGIEPAELHQAAGFLTDALPSLPVYLRTKYGELPDEAQLDLQRYLKRLHRKYELAGPAPGEDELPEDPSPSTKRTRGGKR